MTDLSHDVAERPRILTDPIVAGDKRHELWRLPQQLHRRKMNRVERANGFDRKWAPGPGQHGVRDGNDGAATLERPQASKGTALLRRGHPTRDSGA